MSSSNDNFKWFGEGFDGFPKRLPDDCVEYCIYIVDENLKDSNVRDLLRKVQTTSSTLSKKLLKDFIWQRESFALELVREDGKSLLRGRTNYGDSVEDEWLIVYLLREISFQHPNVWIRVIDSDGEFLLIEAANTLPKWLNPEIADNRVWLNNGQLFVIPRNTKQGSKDIASDHRSLTLQEALDRIQKGRSQLLHSPLIEAEAFFRLQNYPRQINQNLHHARATVPRKLAYLLHKNPAYISPAVEAFYLRDPIALRPLQQQNPAQLIFPPVDMVSMIIKFTRVGYAQLRSQQFPPPPTWFGVLSTAIDQESITQLELGMKVTCGFEILLSDSHNRDKRAVREMELLLEDVSKGEDDLPTDDEISTWISSADNDDWLDINFEDFDRELSGQGRGQRRTGGGFGDKSTEENLQKMVARFEQFLNDDTAGDDEAEFSDDMDNDNDDESDESTDGLGDEDEDKEASFDESEFNRLMKEMMGIPTDQLSMNDNKSSGKGKQAMKPSEVEGPGRHNGEEDEKEEIERLAREMEIELREAGALRLDNRNSKKEKRMLRGGTTSKSSGEETEEDDDTNEELNIDFNLVKNMLESFKSQAGNPGPGGNLMGMMGLRLPRDEGEDSVGMGLSQGSAAHPEEN